jgi:dTDP-glucose 4,6-dehydratase
VRFVVTGGCGYIGSAVVRTLVERGDHVLNIDSRPKSQTIPALAPLAGRDTYVRLESTIRDPSLLKALIYEYRPDRIIHLASSAETDPVKLFETEIATTLAVLAAAKDYAARLPEAARHSFRIAQAARVPRPTSGSASSPRLLAQRAVEALASNWCKANDLSLVTCMADEVFGPWQSADCVLPRALAGVLAGSPVELSHDGHTVRDFLPIADFARGLALAAETGAPHACYELSVGAERREVDVVEAAISILDKRRPHPGGSLARFLRRVGRPPTDSFSPMLDPAPAERDLRWTPGGFYEGLTRMAAFMVSQSAPNPAPAVPLRMAAE